MSRIKNQNRNSPEFLLRRQLAKLCRKILISILILVCVAITAFALVIRHQNALLSEQLLGTAVEDVKVALIDSTREKIENIAFNTAAEIAEFLNQRDQDIMLLAELMPSNESYRVFSENRNSNMVPLYDEITFIDLEGQEMFKYVSGGSTKRNFPMNPETIDITNNSNTFAGREDYWNALQALRPGEIFVSDVIGEPVNEGQHFEGIIRWATPVLDFDDEIAGFVTMALNHDHILNIMENTAIFSDEHTPNNIGVLRNFMYIRNNSGVIIAHTMHEHILSDTVFEIPEQLHTLGRTEAIQFFTGQFSSTDNAPGFGLVSVVANADDFIAPAVTLEEKLNDVMDTRLSENMRFLLMISACIVLVAVLIIILLIRAVPTIDVPKNSQVASNRPERDEDLEP